MNEEVSIKEINYNNEWDVLAYLNGCQNIYKEINLITLNFLKFLIEKIIEKLPKNTNFSNIKFLELGSGPSAFGIISASKYFSNITLSDYCKENINFLKEWKYNDAPLHGTTSNLFSYVAGMEGISDFDKFVNRIKDSIGSIVTCDGRKSNFGIENSYNSNEKYDIISCIGTLLCMTNSELELGEILKNFYNNLNKNGWFIVVVSLGVDFYTLQSKRYFHCGTIGADTIIKEMKSVGFKDIITMSQTFRMKQNDGERFGALARKY